MIDVLNSDYILLVQSKGVKQYRMIIRHALRNTLIPIITVTGPLLVNLLTGSSVIERIFGIPGIGFTSYYSMVEGDIPFSMFYMLFLAILTLLGNLITDILYAVVDPRVRIA